MASSACSPWLTNFYKGVVATWTGHLNDSAPWQKLSHPSNDLFSGNPPIYPEIVRISDDEFYLIPERNTATYSWSILLYNSTHDKWSRVCAFPHNYLGEPISIFNKNQNKVYNCTEFHGEWSIVDVKNKSCVWSRKDTGYGSSLHNGYCLVHIDQQLHFINQQYQALQHWTWDYNVNHKLKLIRIINFQPKLARGLGEYTKITGVYIASKKVILVIGNIGYIYKYSLITNSWNKLDCKYNQKCALLK